MYHVKTLNQLSFGVQNRNTNTLLRIGYFAWVMSGSNLVKPLLPYVDAQWVKENSDDGKGVLSAVGARFRNWVGIDSYIKAKEFNDKNVETLSLADHEDRTYCKPTGVDQFEQMYYDLAHEMPISSAGFFDPSVDFKETVKAIDLLTVTFSKFFYSKNEKPMLNMTMVFNEYDKCCSQLNEQFAFMIVHRMMANILGLHCHEVDVIEISTLESQIPIPIVLEFPVGESCEMYDCNELSVDFKYFFDLEKHLKMQANEETFSNPQVAVPQLIQLLSKGLVTKINNAILKDIANTLICCTLIKYTKKYTERDNVYNEQITQFYNQVADTGLKFEISEYADYIGKKIWTGLNQ